MVFILDACNAYQQKTALWMESSQCFFLKKKKYLENAQNKINFLKPVQFD